MAAAMPAPHPPIRAASLGLRPTMPPSSAARTTNSTVRTMAAGPRSPNWSKTSHDRKLVAWAVRPGPTAPSAQLVEDRLVDRRVAHHEHQEEGGQARQEGGGSGHGVLLAQTERPYPRPLARRRGGGTLRR